MENSKCKEYKIKTIKFSKNNNRGKGKQGGK